MNNIPVKRVRAVAELTPDGYEALGNAVQSLNKLKRLRGLSKALVRQSETYGDIIAALLKAMNSSEDLFIKVTDACCMPNSRHADGLTP